MMSQINFFQSREDEIEFTNFLFDQQDTWILSGSFFQKSKPEPLSSRQLPIAQNQITLINKILMPKIEVTTRGLGDLSNVFLFDMYKDPCIQFSRSTLEGNVLLPGRIFAKIGYLEPAETNSLYKSWYSKLERWIKKRYLKVHDFWWIGNGAEKWCRQGGIIALGHIQGKQISFKDF
jgi:hypothetical protein